MSQTSVASVLLLDIGRINLMVLFSPVEYCGRFTLPRCRCPYEFANDNSVAMLNANELFLFGVIDICALQFQILTHI